jgi:hypothetical protein
LAEGERGGYAITEAVTVVQGERPRIPGPALQSSHSRSEREDRSRDDTHDQQGFLGLQRETEGLDET